jgi:hypothetical protein
MKFLLIFIIAYIVFRGLSKMLRQLNLEPKEKTEVEGGQIADKKFGVDKDDIEDAEFKEVD